MRKSQGENVEDSELGSAIIKLMATKPELASVFAKVFMKSDTVSKKNTSKGKRQLKKK